MPMRGIHSQPEILTRVTHIFMTRKNKRNSVLHTWFEKSPSLIPQLTSRIFFYPRNTPHCPLNLNSLPLSLYNYLYSIQISALLVFLFYYIELSLGFYLSLYLQPPIMTELVTISGDSDGSEEQLLPVEINGREPSWRLNFDGFQLSSEHQEKQPRRLHDCLGVSSN